MCCFSRGERSGGVDFVINIWIWMFPATQWFPNASGQFQYYMFFFAHFLESNLNLHVLGQRREFCVFWYYAGEKSDNGQSLDIWRESSVSDGSYAMKTQFQEEVSQKRNKIIGVQWKGSRSFLNIVPRSLKLLRTLLLVQIDGWIDATYFICFHQLVSCHQFKNTENQSMR